LSFYARASAAALRGKYRHAGRMQLIIKRFPVAMFKSLFHAFEESSYGVATKSERIA
jgi:hypothetical protein